jgi:DnaJ-class molecular chaperone
MSNMDNPYEVLQVNPNASPEEIRRRYLTLVREHPPERDPERFAAIRAAYDQVRDPVVSLERRLFDLTWTDTLDSLLAAEQRRLSQQPIPTDVLLSLGNR